MSVALLLIAHGSRHADANDDLRHAAERLGRPDRPAVASFLELAEPNIDDGAGRCVAEGATTVVLVPYFLSAGVHVRRDLTAARDRLAAAHPGVTFVLAEPFGRHPGLLDLAEQRAREALGG